MCVFVCVCVWCVWCGVDINKTGNVNTVAMRFARTGPTPTLLAPEAIVPFPAHCTLPPSDTHTFHIPYHIPMNKDIMIMLETNA